MTLLDNLLSRTFYKAWEKENSFFTLELIVNGKCDNMCTYCYIHRHRDKLFPSGTQDEEKIISNAVLVFEWLKKNNWKPNLEIFSGELYSQQIGFELLDLILSYAWSGLRCVVPTNFNFIFTGNEDKIFSYKKKFKDKGAILFNSASFDGPFMDDENRPCIYGHRDQYWYNTAFEFVKKTGDVGFHPMVYSNGIERWIDNFNWFQDMLKLYDFPWFFLYLLEVRNAEWSEEQIKQYGKFITYLMGYLASKGNVNDLFAQHKGFNILTNIYAKTNKGLACALQPHYHIRLGDLKSFPCHRLMYKEFELFDMKVEENKIVGTNEKNFTLYVATHYCDFKNQPYCNMCGIKDKCMGQCLGAQYESTGDMFTPIPSVCQLIHHKHEIIDSLRNTL
jgi:radical SAM protein with 4Fe4S-binding SPASM domain